jgi:hypothetical protein
MNNCGLTTSPPLLFRNVEIKNLTKKKKKKKITLKVLEEYPI